jgi:hypothetical protein
MPEMRTPFGIAVGAFFFDPHGSRQDQICGLCRDCRICFGYNDEVLGISVTRVCLFVGVRSGLKVVVDLNPIGVELAVAQHAVLQHGVISGLRRDCALRQLPYLLRYIAMPLVGHQHVGWQAM